jgi:hypothetical protein
MNRANPQNRPSTHNEERDADVSIAANVRMVILRI